MKRIVLGFLVLVLLVGVEQTRGDQLSDTIGKALNWLKENDNDWSIRHGDYNVKVIGNGGGIRITKLSTNGSVEVSLDQLSEIDYNGVQKQVQHELDQYNFVWQTPSLETINDIVTTRFEFGALLNWTEAHAGTYLGMVVNFFQEPTTVTHGNQTYTVDRNSAKFTLLIKNWPFLSVDNFLKLMMQIKVNGANYVPAQLVDKYKEITKTSFFVPMGGDHHNRNDDNSDASSSSDSSDADSGDDTGDNRHHRRHHNEKRCQLGTVGGLDVAQYALIDGLDANVTTFLYNELTSGIAIILPYFSQVLEYDPTLYVNAASQTHTMAALTAAIAVFIASISGRLF